MTNKEIAQEIQKLKEENVSLKSRLEALSAKVAQMQLQLNTISTKVDINTSDVLANLIVGDYFEEKEELFKWSFEDFAKMAKEEFGLTVVKHKGEEE